MPKFSQRSLDQLATCDERLQKIAHKAIEIIDFTVIEGHRGKEAQDAAFAKGMTQVHWPLGKHNSMPSMAMDIAPYPIDFSDKRGALERFVFLHGIIHAIAHDLGITIRHGIDWNMDNDMRDERFRDYPHIELSTKEVADG